jgi:hypothetical protein
MRHTDAAEGLRIAGVASSTHPTARFTRTPPKPAIGQQRAFGPHTGVVAAPKTLIGAAGFGQGVGAAAHAPVRPPGAPGAAGSAPLPVDPQYDAAIAAATRARDSRLAALSGQRSQTLTEYGYTPQADGAGNITGLTFDPTNSFSQAALAKKAWDTKRRANTSSYAARGQLYAGALQNAQNDANTGQLQSQDALQKALLGFLSRNTADVADTQGGYVDAVTQAQADRLSGAATNPLYQPIPSNALPSTAELADAIAAARTGAAVTATRAPGGHSTAAVRRALAQRTTGRPKVRLPQAKFARQNTPLRHLRP